MNNAEDKMKNLSPKQKQLLYKLLGKKEKSTQKEIELKRYDRNKKYYPMSYAQLRIWFLEKLNPGNLAYNMVSCLKISGEIDYDVFNKSLNKLIEQQETLRTVFGEIDRKPYQRVLDPLHLKLNIVDISHESQALQKKQIKDIIMNEYNRKFDLVEGPLLRTSIVRQDENVNYFIISMHHIIMDGWSMGIFMKYMLDNYYSLINHDVQKLEPPELQYIDYTYWQHEMLESGLYQHELNYWCNELKNAPEVIQLPIDYQRSLFKSSNGGSYTVEIDSDTYKKVIKLGDSYHCTVFMTLLAVFNVLLNRYTGQKDILIGTPIACRNQVELENIIGLFANTIVIRSTFDDDSTFVDILTQIRKKSIEDFANQNLPFDRIVDELKVERDTRYTPIFQVMFVLHNTPSKLDNRLGLEIEPINYERNTAKFDLILTIGVEDDHCNATFEYASNLFCEETIVAMSEYYIRLLNEVIENPNKNILEYPIADSMNGQTLLPDMQSGIVEWFDQCAAKDMNQVAIEEGDRVYTYREVKESVDNLASYLVSEGYGSGSLIGVLLEPSYTMIVTILGILKAGAIGAPVTEETLRSLQTTNTDDIQLDLILTQEKYRECLTKSRAHVFYMEHANDNILVDPDRLEVKRKQNDASYIGYHADKGHGCKGNFIGYSELSNSLRWLADKYQIGKSDVILCHKTTYSDRSFFEMFVGLISGAKIVFHDENFEHGVFDKSGITMTFFEYEDLTHVLYDENDLDNDYRSMKHIFLMMDEINSRQIQDLYQCMNQAEHLQIHRLYQLGNILTNLLYYDFERKTEMDTIPLGKPIEGLACHVLNARLQEQPKNVEGMLYLRVSNSDSRNSTYVNSLSCNKNLICTGIYASYNQSGDIVYLGKSEETPEVRRYRRELKELQLTMLRHEAVRDVALKVVVREEVSTVIYAYVVKRQEIDASELKEYLANVLSRKLIPQRFIFVDKIKEQKRLTYSSEIQERISYHSREQVDFTTENERILAEIWKHVLGVDNINSFSGFFSMGGDSIKAILMLAELHERGLELEMKELLLHPNIKELALQLKVKKSEVSRDKESTITPVVNYTKAEITDIIEYVKRKTRENVSVKYIYPLTFTQERMLFYSLFHPKQGTFVQQYIFYLEGMFHLEIFKKAVNKIVERYDVLRTLFLFKGVKNPLQVVLKERDVDVSYIDLTDKEPLEYEQLCKKIILNDKEKAFNLLKDLLMRFIVIKGDCKRFCVIWSHHHIILDGWCAGIILKEIMGLYGEYTLGRSYKMNTVVPYFEYIKWLQEVNQKESLSYWKEVLSDIDSSKMISSIHTGKVKVYGLGMHEIIIDKDITYRLDCYVKGVGVTLNTLIQCVWGVMLQRILDTNDVVFGSIVSGRPPQVSGIENMIGLFVNAIPVRVKNQGKNFRDLMQKLHTSSILALEHSYISIMELQDEMKMKNELFDHVIAFENLPFKELVNQSTQGIFECTSSKVLQETNYNLNIIINPGEEIHIEFNYNQDCFDEACISRISENLRNMLMAVLDDNDITVERLKELVNLHDILQ